MLSNKDGPLSGKINLLSIVWRPDYICDGFCVTSFFSSEEFAFVELPLGP